MKLRSHPSMSYRGFQNWPPVWMREFGSETYPVREVGILEDVHKSTPENHCFLVIKYNGSRYVGIIQCDDQDFLRSSITVKPRLRSASSRNRRARARSKLMDHMTSPSGGRVVILNLFMGKACFKAWLVKDSSTHWTEKTVGPSS